jgi:NADH-quinone oxidoreductase subunit A
MPSTALLIFLLCSLFMVGAAMLISHLLAPKSKNLQKADPIECGVPTRGTAWI